MYVKKIRETGIGLGRGLDGFLLRSSGCISALGFESEGRWFKLEWYHP